MSSRPLVALLTLTAMLGATAGSAQVITSPRAAGTATTKVTDLSPPAACTQSANDWSKVQVAPARAAYSKATDSTRPALMKTYVAALNAASAGVQKMSADCAAQFNVATIPAAQLMDLITLYNTARDTTNSRLATERVLTEKNLPPRVHAQALMLAMNQESIKDPSYFGIIDGAERYVREIDALPDSLDDVKLLAHERMMGRYEYLDVAEGLYQHATAVIALGRKLGKKTEMISGYSSLARSYADRLHPDSALRILDAGEREIGPTATERFKDFRERYALIGTQAPKITAEWWINPDAAGFVAPAPGKVTLVEFTAHWCGPCKNSYPGLRSLSQRLKGLPFTGFMVTQLYGYLGTQRDLTPAQEVAADREYFGKEHALPFPVAINLPAKPVPGVQFAQPQPDTDYHVGGIPQIMIIDKQGIIRQIVTGWDQGNTERFSKYINQLIAEKL